MATNMELPIDVDELRGRVQDMYRRVAHEPAGEFHFEMGRSLAERLDYAREDLDQVPARALESFAGVGHYFDLADLQPGETVLDLGSGSGTDSFIAARNVGPNGHVIGVDMTREQVEKSARLAERAGLPQVSFRLGYLEELPVEDASIDCVISNGVINLCPDKQRVFAEIHRVLRPGGRLAQADIITDKPLPDSVTCDSSLWAACIGGAAERGRYRAEIESAGLRIVRVRDNPEYRFLSGSAQGAMREYGVVSVSLLAERAPNDADVMGK